MKNFAKEAPAGFFDKRADLGQRLRRAAPWVAAQLAPAPTDRHACLVHGDLKAMNAFLPRDNPDPDALLIDFASTGVGYGMADVAMHLCHALMPGDLRTHEADLLQRYLRFLGQETTTQNLRGATTSSRRSTTGALFWAASGARRRPTRSGRSDTRATSRSCTGTCRRLCTSSSASTPTSRSTKGR